MSLDNAIFDILGNRYGMSIYVNNVQISYQLVVILSLKIWGQSLLSLDNDVISHANKVKDTVIFNSFFFCQVSTCNVVYYFRTYLSGT